MDRKRVTQQQILDRTGINRSTLREWRLKGIIPPGTLGVHPTKGRGRVLTYSPATAFKIEMLVNIIYIKIKKKKKKKKIKKNFIFINKYFNLNNI